MRIDSIATYRVQPRWHFIRIATDSGITGWGEITLEGNDLAVAGTVEAFRHFLIGCDPGRISDIWQRLYRSGFYRGGPVLLSAISGIEQALWDIKGKALGVPVHELFGGAVRDRIRMYSHAHGDTTEELAANAGQVMAKGYTAVKTTLPGPIWPRANPSYLLEIRHRFEAIRNTVGQDADIAIDLHGRSTPAQSVEVIKMLDDLNLMFYEEPVLPESFEALATVRSRVTATLATGERLYGKWSFFDLISKGLVDVVQPDISHAGGIAECRHIAAMAESRHIPVALHCPLGPIALAACLQLDAVIPNFLIQEHVTLGEGYLKNDFELIDGFIKVPDGPGLGIDVDTKSVENNALTGPWTTPTWDQIDGSLGDW